MDAKASSAGEPGRVAVLVRGAARARVPAEVRACVPEIHARLAVLDGDAADEATLAAIRRSLAAFPAWTRWIGALRSAGSAALWIGAGLELSRNTPAARRLFTGLGASLYPEAVVPPFAVGGEAVTDVTPLGGSAASHSRNDLPAPLHTAGFFEPAPPLALLFACVRPHPGGGAATTVVDLPGLLERADAADVASWSARRYLYRTSARLGATVHPLRLLRSVSGRPFLRYRREYALAEGPARASLAALDRMVRDPVNVLEFPLAADEALLVWNGTPHGRTPQLGPTPADPDRRRLLLRCRLQPPRGWAERFARG